MADDENASGAMAGSNDKISPVPISAPEIKTCWFCAAWGCDDVVGVVLPVPPPPQATTSIDTNARSVGRNPNVSFLCDRMSNFSPYIVSRQHSMVTFSVILLRCVQTSFHPANRVRDDSQRMISVCAYRYARVAPVRALLNQAYMRKYVPSLHRKHRCAPVTMQRA